MTQQFVGRQLRFFLTAPSPCPYLPGRTERKVFAHLPLIDGATLNDALSHAGFRRSQNIAYRPACETCDACVSARVVVTGRTFSRSERKVLARNRDLSAHWAEAEATTEQYDLLKRYILSRHEDGGMSDMSWHDYIAMVEDTSARTHLIEYRLPSTDDGPGQLIACVLVDALADGLSLVYSFFDPDMSKRGLGTFVILDHLRQAAEVGFAYVYLGYYVRGSEKMSYKERFQPLELLSRDGWKPFTA